MNLKEIISSITYFFIKLLAGKRTIILNALIKNGSVVINHDEGALISKCDVVNDKKKDRGSKKKITTEDFHQYLKEHGISAIFVGKFKDDDFVSTGMICSDFNSRLRLVHMAKIEMSYLDLRVKASARDWFNADIQTPEVQKEGGYFG